MSREAHGASPFHNFSDKHVLGTQVKTAFGNAWQAFRVAYKEEPDWLKVEATITFTEASVSCLLTERD